MSATDTPKVLVVYYSFTQQTRAVANTMAETLRGRGYDVTEAAIGFTDSAYSPRFSKLPMEYRKPFEDMGVSSEDTQPAITLPAQMRPPARAVPPAPPGSGRGTSPG